MLTLNDGRSELWQWDTGRTLAVDADCSQVHFSNKVFGRSIDVDVVDGTAIIPDVLLQTDKDLNVWAFVGTAENGYTKISKTFKVNRRNKPADYVFTPVEQTTIAEIAAIAQSVRDDADAGLFDGKDGKDGYTPQKGVDYFDGAPGADGKTPEYGVDYGTPEQIAGIAQSAAEILQPDVNQIKDDLSAEQTAREQADASLQQDISGKLPKSPTSWEPWTAEEQAAARERMGIPGDYEMIENIITTEETNGIERSVEPDGTPYNFISVFIKIHCPAADYNGTLNVRYYVGYDGIIAYVTNAVDTVERFGISKVITVNGYLEACGSAASSTGHAGLLSILATSYSEYLTKKGYINKIFLNLQGSKILPVGTEILIYGVRA